MKKAFIIIILSIVYIGELSAQTKKKYCYIDTESSSVFKSGTFEWKPEIPYKKFVRLISEVFEAPNEYYITGQFYEYVLKNNLIDFKKMKLHKDWVRLSIFDYYNPHEPEEGYGYKSLFKPIEKSSWQYEVILIKGFKYDPNNKGPFPLLEKAKGILIKGLD